MFLISIKLIGLLKLVLLNLIFLVF